MAQCITIETRAINDRSLYTKPDIFGRVPDNNIKEIAVNDAPKCAKPQSNDSYECISSKINLPDVCQKVTNVKNKSQPKIIL